MCGVNYWYFIKDFGLIVVRYNKYLLRKMSLRVIGIEFEVYFIIDIEVLLLLIVYLK